MSAIKGKIYPKYDRDLCGNSGHLGNDFECVLATNSKSGCFLPELRIFSR
jgi:hypothetical protein